MQNENMSTPPSLVTSRSTSPLTPWPTPLATPPCRDVSSFQKEITQLKWDKECLQQRCVQYGRRLATERDTVRDKTKELQAAKTREAELLERNETLDHIYKVLQGHCLEQEERAESAEDRYKIMHDTLNFRTQYLIQEGQQKDETNEICKRKLQNTVAMLEQDQRRIKKIVAGLELDMARTERCAAHRFREMERAWKDEVWGRSLATRALGAAEEELNRVKEKLETKLDPMKCIICKDNDRNTVPLSCKHLTSCEGCLSKVDNCPICRVPIIGGRFVTIS